MKSLFGKEMTFRRVFFGLLTVALVVVALIVVYHDYAYSLLCREFDGDRTEFIGFKIRLPLFWFKTDAQLFGQSFVGRAYPGYLAGEPVITAMPISNGDVKNTDAEVLYRRQRDISGLSVKLDDFKSAAAIDIHSKAFTLYCTRNGIGSKTTNLSCSAAKIPFILYYTGPSAIEPEAEAIFSSFEVSK